MFKDKSILITGGTGSLGKALTNHILTNHQDIRKQGKLLMRLSRFLTKTIDK
jgi:FlaA1/EpsC-like NDP-sugar epimerase